MVDEAALAKVQDQYARENGKYRDVSIRKVIEAYEESLSRPADCVLEGTAKVIYDAMLWAKYQPGANTPWRKNGNSFAQDKARDAAREIISALPLRRDCSELVEDLVATLKVCRVFTKKYLGMVEGELDGARITELREIHYQADAALPKVAAVRPDNTSISKDEVQPTPQSDVNLTTSDSSTLLDVLRQEGWMVAVHNDYRLNGDLHTFWLFTRGNQCVKGEGRTDKDALTEVFRALPPQRDDSGMVEKLASALEGLLSNLGPGGYIPSAGKPATDTARAVLAKLAAAKVGNDENGKEHSE